MCVAAAVSVCLTATEAMATLDATATIRTATMCTAQRCVLGGGRSGSTDLGYLSVGGREGLVHRFAAACLGTSEGGVRRWVVVCSARRSARVVRGLLRAFLYLRSYPPGVKSSKEL